LGLAAQGFADAQGLGLAAQGFADAQGLGLAAQGFADAQGLPATIVAESDIDAVATLVKIAVPLIVRIEAAATVAR